MKSSIVENCRKASVAVYPCIMMNKKGGFIVLFSSCDSGSVIVGSNVGSVPEYKPGYYSSDWRGARIYPEKWELIDTITIKFEM